MEFKTYQEICKITKPIVDCIEESIMEGGTKGEKQIHLKNVSMEHLKTVVPMYIAKGWDMGFTHRNEQQVTKDSPVTCDATIIIKFK